MQRSPYRHPNVLPYREPDTYEPDPNMPLARRWARQLIACYLIAFATLVGYLGVTRPESPLPSVYVIAALAFPAGLAAWLSWKLISYAIGWSERRDECVWPQGRERLYGWILMYVLSFFFVYAVVIGSTDYVPRPFLMALIAVPSAVALYLVFGLIRHVLHGRVSPGRRMARQWIIAYAVAFCGLASTPLDVLPAMLLAFPAGLGVWSLYRFLRYAIG